MKCVNPCMKCVSVFMLVLMIFGRPALAEEMDISVVASFSILGDLVMQVGGPHVRVTTLVGPDEDAHLYEPTAQDAVTISNAQLVVQNGLHFEGWFPRLLRSAGYQGPVVIASEGVEPLRLAGEMDPHAWQSLRHIRIYAAHIAGALIQLRPEASADFLQRRDQFLADVERLETRARNLLALVPAERRKVVTSHDAFAYLAADFGLQFLAPLGLSTDHEASGASLAALIRQIRHDRISAMFIENIADPRLLNQIARETGITLGGRLYSDALSPPDGPAGTYLKMMDHNLTALTRALTTPSNLKIAD